MDRFKAYLLPAAAALLLLAYYLWRWTSGEPVAEPPAKTPAAPRATAPAEPKASPSSEPVPLEVAPEGATPQAELRAPSPEPRAGARP